MAPAAARRETAQVTALAYFPAELWRAVAAYLDVRGLAMAGAVCSAVRRGSLAEPVWAAAVAKEAEQQPHLRAVAEASSILSHRYLWRVLALHRPPPLAAQCDLREPVRRALSSRACARQMRGVAADYWGPLQRRYASAAARPHALPSVVPLRLLADLLRAAGQELPAVRYGDLVLLPDGECPVYVASASSDTPQRLLLRLEPACSLFSVGDAEAGRGAEAGEDLGSPRAALILPRLMRNLPAGRWKVNPGVALGLQQCGFAEIMLADESS
eukprot:TRINITY_DN11894_c0_g1_i1.p1 TRINITY_DN11894_c0_g1~~TRINITY_DN11894_c0_g1_i1.p1  ORF type:complete len:271 (+),score=71.18 TRINITY_DN11894_c0_g1_i1:83-895(+)